MIIADLHIHSRYSRATAHNITPENLYINAHLKGVDLIGTGDFTHPAWFTELTDKLNEVEEGTYELQPFLISKLKNIIPPSCLSTTRFLLSGEISTIYKRNGRVRKIHSLIIMPNFKTVKRFNTILSRIGNITSDGRPILGLDVRDLLKICLEIDPRIIFIPAHIWTPWFSLFGSNSGFDSIEECFGNLTQYIYALETGLSSNPIINWQLSTLDRFILVSHSDAHSPNKIAREANLLNCEPTYAALNTALTKPSSKTFIGTLEFYPEEGKYYMDGHRKCGIKFTPEETNSHNNNCPICKRTLTIGVLNRTKKLADRPLGFRPNSARYFESIIPLSEIVAEVSQKKNNSKYVTDIINNLIYALGPELHILRNVALNDITKAGGPNGELLAEGIRRMRNGEVILEGGFDGQFGTVHLFNHSEWDSFNKQTKLWIIKKNNTDLINNSNKTNQIKKIDPHPTSSKILSNINSYNKISNNHIEKEKLNKEQIAAIEHRGAPLLVRAGPGTGKTRLLIYKMLSYLKEGISPNYILMITFTNKAAFEITERLTSILAKAKNVRVCTFHSLGKEIISHSLGYTPKILDEKDRKFLISSIAKKNGINQKKLASTLTRLKQYIELPKDPEEITWLNIYQNTLSKNDFLDIDDLVRKAVIILNSNPHLAKNWQKKFSHILIDEYQDVNPAQIELLQILRTPYTQITAIGDPDQAIYGFRGANPQLFNDFKKTFHTSQELSLIHNYRSNQFILNAAQKVIEDNPDSLRVPLKAKKNYGPSIISCELSNPKEEAKWIMYRILELIKGTNSLQVEIIKTQQQISPLQETITYGPGDIAVIYRLHDQGTIIQKTLEQASIPVQKVNEEPLTETDQLNFKSQQVTLLTIHAAKGLEFPLVFIAGVEDGLIPYQYSNKDSCNINEERRLLYVAMTRAKDQLFLTRCKKRTIYGRTIYPNPSPFLNKTSLIFYTPKKNNYQKNVQYKLNF